MQKQKFEYEVVGDKFATKKIGSVSFISNIKNQEKHCQILDEYLKEILGNNIHVTIERGARQVMVLKGRRTSLKTKVLKTLGKIVRRFF